MKRNSKLYVYNVKAWIYDKLIKSPLPPGQQNGELQVKYADSDGGQGIRMSDAATVNFQITSVWVDPGNPSARRVCKAFAEIPHKPSNAAESQALKFCEMLRKDGAAHVRSGGIDMRLFVDRYFKAICFSSESEPYGSSNPDTWGTIPIWDSKGFALNAMFKSIESNSSSKVTGVDMMNLNAISDETMIELGFTKVPDQLGLGVPMWYGDPEATVTLGGSSYRYTGYNTKPDNEQESSREEVVSSLLDLIELELA